MHSDPKLVARLDALAETHGFTRKSMFGGYCWFLGGNICCGVWHENLILRLGPDAALAALDRDRVLPFDITGRPMRNWVMVEPAGFRTKKQLGTWVGQAVAFVETLPTKPKSSKVPKAKKKAGRASRA